MARNRLQSALSSGVIVVESGDPGGALQTAEDARRQGRPVYAVHWPDDRPEAAGNRRLLAQGAEPAEEVGRLVEELRLHRMGRKPQNVDAQGPQQLSLF
jgi:predicted Rossmann fold nucleotide-binding protein DprA/Smf involved in DNA uptake